jgi:hypothetical protein
MAPFDCRNADPSLLSSLPDRATVQIEFFNRLTLVWVQSPHQLPKRKQHVWIGGFTRDPMLHAGQINRFRPNPSLAQVIQKPEFCVVEHDPIGPFPDASGTNAEKQLNPDTLRHVLGLAKVSNAMFAEPSRKHLCQPFVCTAESAFHSPILKASETPDVSDVGLVVHAIFLSHFGILVR